MTEEHDECNVCGASSVMRIPSILGEVFIASPEKAGELVNKTIDETREEIEKMNKEASRGIDI